MITVADQPILLTAADLAERFGPLPLARFRFVPSLGTATEQDVLAIHESEDRLCELVDGVLVEKAVGYSESILAAALIRLLAGFAQARNLGAVAGEGGMVRLAPGLVRIPDVSFIPWSRFPDRKVPSNPLPDLTPDLAVEVLSASNTAEEMRRKLHDYFAAGCRLVWLVDGTRRTVIVYTSPDHLSVLTENDVLDGGIVLPGFTLPLRELFAELDAH